MAGDSARPGGEVELLPDRLDSLVILDFTWPEVRGSAEGLLFWGTIVEPSTMELIGAFDYVTFGYR